MTRAPAFAGSLLAALALAVPAQALTIEVTNTDDSGAGTLRDAITIANASAGADVVDATGLSGAIVLQSALPQISGAVEIKGPGSGELSLRRAAGDDYRLLSISLPAVAEVSVSGLALIGEPGADQGGGISSTNADLALQDVVVSGHACTCDGAGVEVSSGSLLVSDSTIADNRGLLGGGILISSGAHLTMERTTVSGNRASIGGGGLVAFVSPAGHLIRNSTIVGNAAEFAESMGGGIEFSSFPAPFRIESSTVAGNSAQFGANISAGTSSDVLELHNSIVAYPEQGVNCLGGGSGTWNSVGHNIADDGSCGLDQPSDQAGVDPLLGPLADNGGPTQTRAPEPGSPAIDQGFAGGLGPAIDQRGLRRTVDFLAVPNPAGGDGSDVGAVERQDVTVPTLSVGKARVNGRRRTVGLRFKVSDDATPKREILVRCKLDRKKPRRCASPLKYRRLKRGRHRIVVRARDAAGNEAQASKRFRVRRAKR